ncbi:Tyrosine recombinase XerC [subsurface metagenome]
MSANSQTITFEEGRLLLAYLLKGNNDNPANYKQLRNYTITLLMLHAGLRVGEVVKLELRDLVFNGDPVKAVTMRAATTKTKTERTVPLSILLQSAIASIIKAIPDGDGLASTWSVFTGSNNKTALTVRQVERIIKAASLAAFGRAITPHVLRHTFATRLMKVLDIRGVQTLLGHKHLSSTQIYTHPDADSLKSAIETVTQHSA